jgi:hypothetical protein
LPYHNVMAPELQNICTSNKIPDIRAEHKRFFAKVDSCKEYCPIGRVPKFTKKFRIRDFQADPKDFNKRGGSRTHVKTLSGFQEHVWPERTFIKALCAQREAYFAIYSLVEFSLKYGVTNRLIYRTLHWFANGICHEKYFGRCSGTKSVLSYKLRDNLYQFFRTRFIT